MSDGTVFHHSSLQPLSDQSQDDSISNPTLHEGTQVFVVQRVKELPKVDLYNVAASLSD
jgi:hypothetical protein